MKILALLILSTLTLPAETNSAVKLPPKGKVKIYLLMGQSNMAGRGVPEKEDLTPHPRVLMFSQSNQWEIAVEPITRGEKKKTPGVGPGLAFGKTIAETNPEITVALVPCAVGGTPLKRWMPGADLYSNAVVRAKTAAQFGTISGIIWHQGESDAGSKTNATTYGERLAKMITAIRMELKSPQLPFVVGQIGEFNYNRDGNPQPFAREVNETLANISQRVPRTACALSRGLGHKGDQLHFDAKAQRELGKRYAAEMLLLEKSPRLKQADSERKLLQK